MGRPSAGLSPQIEQLKNHHKCMARDIVAGSLRNVDLARIYNMTESQISIIINSPCFVAYMAELEDKVEENICELREDIRLLVPRASQIIKEELFKEAPENQPLGLQERKLRLATAFEIWDRDSGRKKHGESGAKEVHFHDHREIHISKNMSTEELQRDVFDLLTDTED